MKLIITSYTTTPSKQDKKPTGKPNKAKSEMQVAQKR